MEIIEKIWWTFSPILAASPLVVAASCNNNGANNNTKVETPEEKAAREKAEFKKKCKDFEKTYWKEHFWAIPEVEREKQITSLKGYDLFDTDLITSPGRNDELRLTYFSEMCEAMREQIEESKNTNPNYESEKAAVEVFTTKYSTGSDIKVEIEGQMLDYASFYKNYYARIIIEEKRNEAIAEGDFEKFEQYIKQNTKHSLFLNYYQPMFFKKYAPIMIARMRDKEQLLADVRTLANAVKLKNFIHSTGRYCDEVDKFYNDYVDDKIANIFGDTRPHNQNKPQP